MIILNSGSIFRIEWKRNNFFTFEIFINKKKNNNSIKKLSKSNMHKFMAFHYKVGGWVNFQRQNIIKNSELPW